MQIVNSVFAYIYICKVTNDKMSVKRLHFWNMREVNTLNGDELSSQVEAQGYPSIEILVHQNYGITNQEIYLSGGCSNLRAFTFVTRVTISIILY